MSSPLTVECPTCGSPVEWSEAARWRPFCSERCRLIDLGAWFTEDRGIPGEDAAEQGSAAPRDDDAA